MGLAMCYGMTFGTLYAALRPERGDVLTKGAALGIATWAAGFLGWLPAAGLMPPPWRQNARQVTVPILTHVGYGLATAAAYEWLRDRAERM